ncbi:MAG: APC family permease, partial [Firmicutes bacterium]|nr:APC family permease [Bacillota bacterium]
MRVQNLLFAVATLGLIAAAAVLALHDPQQARAAFDRYAGAFTGYHHTYHHILQALGTGAVHVEPLNWHSTLVSMTWPFTVLGFSIASAYIGGEIKGANRAQILGMPGSLLYSALWILLLTWAVLHAFGYRFMGNLGAVNPAQVHLGFTPT